MIVSRDELSPIDFEGLEIYDYTSKANPELGSSFAVIEVPPKKSHRAAVSHRSDKYYFVVHGQLDFVLDDQPIALRAGDLCVVRQGRRFAYSNSSDTPAQLVLVHTPSFQMESEEFLEGP